MKFSAEALQLKVTLMPYFQSRSFSNSKTADVATSVADAKLAPVNLGP
jgi:hypothetical protein